MRNEPNTNAADDFELKHFERNRYFQGKLMTAHDMATEQEYHAARFETLNRLVSGTGIVSGLSITEFEHDDGELRVTLSPGVAIDSEGRPIIVRTPTTRTIPTDESEYVSLHIVYGEEPKDPVPIPGVEATEGDQSEESRVLEIFELVATETPPASTKTPPIIEFPELDDTDEYTDLADKLVDAYHEASREHTEPTAEGVFLGAFERLPDGHWELHETDTRQRPFVYDNDMLFSLFVSQLATSGTVHRSDETANAEFLDSELDQISEFAAQMQEIEATVAELRGEIDSETAAVRSEVDTSTDAIRTDLESEIESLRESVESDLRATESELRSDFETVDRELSAEVDELRDALRSQTELSAYNSVKSAIQSFETAAERFKHHSEASKRALETVETARTALVDTVDRDPDQYRGFLDTVTNDVDEFAAVVEDAATTESYEQFAGTVESLDTALETDSAFVELVTAFDRLCQNAALLEPRYEIHTE